MSHPISQYPSNRFGLPRSSPEAQGVRSEAVLDFLRTADQSINQIHSFMLVRHGHVVAEAWWAPEAPAKPHVLWSLSKSFTSTAIGLLVSEGRLNLQTPVIEFCDGALPHSPSQNLRAMTVRDLLTMTTGHETEPPLRQSENWTDEFFNHEVKFQPGTHFVYNSAATYMLSVILQKVTGETLLQYLRPRLFEPLGIENPVWDSSPQGYSLGGWGLHIRTEDIAKFGQLYLQRGEWNGQQLVPANWLDQATSKQVSNGENPNSDWAQGYGFQFWRCRHNAYRGDGRDGQFCVVLPDQDAVIAMTALTSDLQTQLNLVWDKVLPAFSSTALPENSGQETKLKEFAIGLSVSE